MKYPQLNVLGGMSGSSLDGLDLALVQFDYGANSEFNYKFLSTESVFFTKELSEKLRKTYKYSADELLGLEVDFTKFCISAIDRFSKSTLYPIDLIGFHGHTTYHNPESGYSQQICNGEMMSAALKTDTITRFRDKDIALGGQGAPLVPIVEKYLFDDWDGFINLGGITNISVHNSTKTEALDVTACNQALNYLASKLGLAYDDNGRIASSGRLNDEMFSKLRNLDYHKKKAPKSLSNTWVQKTFIALLDAEEDSIANKLHTVCHFIARQIVEDFLRLSIAPSKVLITGGGAHNSFLTDLIIQQLINFDISASKGAKETIDHKESLLMAFMAYLRINQLPNVLSSVTGSSYDNCSGVLSKYFK